MKKVILIFIAAAIITFAGCSGSKSTIDIKKMEDNFKKNDDRSKYNDAARKSIFPKMKDK